MFVLDLFLAYIIILLFGKLCNLIKICWFDSQYDNY